MAGEEIFSIEGKTALITGGTGGIGYMIAEGYVRAGARVYVSSRKAPACEEAERALAKLGEAHAIVCDVSREEQCRELIATFTDREPKLDILVNNAGTTWGAPFDEFPVSAWEKVLAVNVTAPFLLTLAPTILVNAIAAGPFPSKMTAAVLEKNGRALAARVPVGRIGEPQDVAATAIYLASRASSFMTGAVIPLDGGLSTTIGVTLQEA